jgi:RNA polymerase sigma factor (sigma-70 family)
MLQKPKPKIDAIRDGKSGETEFSDERLIGLITKADRYAFETLYRRYFPRLARFLDRMTRSAQIIEEIINDTMLVVWQKPHTYNHSCKVSTWIFSIAYRKALKAIHALDQPIESDFEQFPAETAHEPEYEIRHRQLQKTVARALDALSIEQRVVLVLTYYHGMDQAEIAETMECPVNTVKTRMFHGRRRLKTLLSGEMEKI